MSQYMHIFIWHDLLVSLSTTSVFTFCHYQSTSAASHRCKLSRQLGSYLLNNFAARHVMRWALPIFRRANIECPFKICGERWPNQFISAYQRKRTINNSSLFQKSPTV